MTPFLSLCVVPLGRRSSCAALTYRVRTSFPLLGDRISTYIPWNSSVWKSCLLPQLLIYSITYPHQYGLADIYFIFWVTSQYCFILLPRSSSFNPWELFRLFPGVLCPLTYPSMFCSELFLTFRDYQLSRLILYISCPSLRIIHFPKEP